MQLIYDFLIGLVQNIIEAVLVSCLFEHPIVTLCSLLLFSIGLALFIICRKVHTIEQHLQTLESQQTQCVRIKKKKSVRTRQDKD